MLFCNTEIGFEKAIHMYLGLNGVLLILIDFLCLVVNTYIFLSSSGNDALDVYNTFSYKVRTA